MSRVPGSTREREVRCCASRNAFTVPQKSVSSRPRMTSALAISWFADSDLVERVMARGKFIRPLLIDDRGLHRLGQFHQPA